MADKYEEEEFDLGLDLDIDLGFGFYGEQAEEQLDVSEREDNPQPEDNVNEEWVLW